MSSAMSRPVRCSVPIGTDRSCNGRPARVRFPGNLPTCEAHAHVITGTQDIANGAAPLCDFCTSAQPIALYAAAAFYARDTATGPMVVPASWWGACQVCAAAIDAGDLDGLERQWATAHRRLGRDHDTRWSTSGRHNSATDPCVAQRVSGESGPRTPRFAL